MRRKRWKLLRGISSDVQRLTVLTEELRDMRASEKQAREDLAAERERAEDSEAKLNAKIKELTKARNRARSERDKLSTQLETIQNSQSFKIGHAIVQVARFPLRALRGLRSGARRMLPGGRQRPQLESASMKARKKASQKPPKPPKPGKAPKPSPEKPSMTIPSDQQFLGPLMEGHSTTMFMVWGLSDEELETLIEDVARLQMMKRDFNPLFVTDSISWAPFQKHGYWFEYIPPAEEWMGHNPEAGWSEFVAERVDSIVATYSPDRIVVYEDAGKREALKRGVLNGVVANGNIQIDQGGKPGSLSGGNGASASSSSSKQQA